MRALVQRQREVPLGFAVVDERVVNFKLLRVEALAQGFGFRRLGEVQGLLDVLGPIAVWCEEGFGLLAAEELAQGQVVGPGGKRVIWGTPGFG